MTTGPSDADAVPATTDPTTGWRRVLVLHIGSFGDTVLSVPALQALRAHIGPSATITLLHNAGPSVRVAPTQIIPDGLIDDVLPFLSPVRLGDDAGDRGPLASVAHRVVGAARRGADATAVLRRIRARRFDAVVNLALADRSRRSLARDRAFFRLAGIAEIVGFDPQPAGAHEARFRLDRLRRAGIPAPLGDGPWLVPSGSAREEAARWREAAGLADDRPIVTVAPATLMDAKRWPTDRWATLGSRLRELGLEPIVVGGPADRAEGDDLIAAWAGGANAAGALTPAGSAALMATAAFHVGVDTGTTHVAAASGTPVVALYSHRAPIEQWAPMGAGHQVLDHPVPCAGCLAVDCPVDGHPCMTGITLDQVWTGVETVRAGVAAR